MNRRAGPPFALPTVPLSALAAATALAVVVVLLSAWSIGDAQGQTVVATAQPAAAAASPVLGLMQGLVGLVVVVGLIFAAGWVMRKVGPRTRASGAVQVVGGASVGPREKVVVVRFNGQTLLLGVAPGHVSLLQASDHRDEPTVAGEPVAPRFADRLRAARGA